MQSSQLGWPATPHAPVCAASCDKVLGQNTSVGQPLGAPATSRPLHHPLHLCHQPGLTSTLTQALLRALTSPSAARAPRRAVGAPLRTSHHATAHATGPRRCAFRSAGGLGRRAARAATGRPKPGRPARGPSRAAGRRQRVQLGRKRIGALVHHCQRLQLVVQDARRLGERRGGTGGGGGAPGGPGGPGGGWGPAAPPAPGAPAAAALTLATAARRSSPSADSAAASASARSYRRSRSRASSSASPRSSCRARGPA